VTPIDPTILARGPEWSVGGLDTTTPAQPAGSSSSFGGVLAQQLGELQAGQDEAAQAAQQLATGQATDPTSVVMAIERARLEMQLASTVRTKAVEAINDIFHTQV
jgi:flagellar hook-basal body complex protein FliE